MKPHKIAASISYFDPFEHVIEAACELVIDKFVNIQFDPAMGVDNIPPFGETCFHEGESECTVSISPHISVLSAIEIMAHELAHVATEGDDHGELWETAFSVIKDRFEEIQKERAENETP